MFSTDYYYSIELFDTYVQKPRLSLKNKILYLYNKDNKFVEKINIKDFQRKYDKLNTNNLAYCHKTKLFRLHLNYLISHIHIH